MSDQLQPAVQNMPALHDTSQLVLDPAAMKSMMDLAKFMSSATATLPKAYQNNPGDCLAVIMQAQQWRMNPYAVAQKTHFINGTAGYEAQLVNAVITGSGAIAGNFKYEWFGPWENIIGKFEVKKSDKGEYRVPGWSLKDEEGLGIRIEATLKGETEPRKLELLLAQARTRNSTLWADDPKQQLAYLAVKKWGRLYTPGVILGVYTHDELEDFAPPPEKDVTSESTVEVEYYTNEEFGEKKASWKEAVITGKKKNEDLISLVESKGKRFTDAQKAEIQAWKFNTKPAATAPQTVDHESPKPEGSDAGGKSDFVSEMEAAEKGGAQ